MPTSSFADHSASLDLPVTQGSLLDFPADPLGCMRALQREHGDVAALEEDRQRIAFVFSPEFNQQVLTDTESFHSRFFAIAGPRNSAQRRVTSGLLSMNGQEHKRNRRMVIGPFQRKAVAGYHGQLVELVEEMLSPWRAGQVRNVFADMKQFMLRVTSAILFGVDHPQIAFEIGHLMEDWVEQNHRLGVAALVPFDRQEEEYVRLLDIAEQVEGRLKQMIEHKRSSTTPGFDVLSLLLRAYDDDGNGMSDAELIGQAAILYGAAHLTTTNSLSWALFLLAQHPEVMRELHDELSPLAGDPPTPEQLDQLPVLGRVVDESLRVLTPSAYSQRLTVEPAQIGPLKLGRGTIVVFSQYITHHRADLFEDPDRFVPDRWQTIKPSPYAYLPFGAGPRSPDGSTGRADRRPRALDHAHPDGRHADDRVARRRPLRGEPRDRQHPLAGEARSSARCPRAAASGRVAIRLKSIRESGSEIRAQAALACPRARI